MLKTKLDKASWPRWVFAAGTAGALVGVGMVSTAPTTGEFVGRGTLLGEAVLGAMLLGTYMTAIAGAQWLVLHRRLPWIRTWAGANSFGGLAGGAVTLTTLAAAGQTPSGILFAVLGGLATFAAVQWVVLRRRVVAPGQVAMSNTLALVATVAGFASLGSVAGTPASGGFAFGALYGITTAAGLSILDRLPEASVPEGKVSV